MFYIEEGKFIANGGIYLHYTSHLCLSVYALKIEYYKLKIDIPPIVTKSTKIRITWLVEFRSLIRNLQSSVRSLR